MARDVVARVFHPVARTSEAHVRYTIDGKHCENVYAYQWNNTTAPSQAELLSLGAEVWATFVRKYQLFEASYVTFREVYCRNIDTEVANEWTYTPTSTVIGLAVGNPGAPNVAYQLIKRTGLTGRSHHGAVRFSGFIRETVTGNHFFGATLANIANLAVSILAPRVGGRFVPAVASRKLGYSLTINALLGPDDVVDSSKRRVIDE